MKKILLLIIIVLLVGCSGTQDTDKEQIKTTATNAQDIKVDVLITVDTYVDESTLNLEPDEGLIMCVGSAEFSVEFAFPAKGGSATVKKGMYRLIDYSCPAYGNARECKVTPAQDTYQEREIGEMAALFENNDIAFAVLDLPVGETIYATHQCLGAPATVPDSGILTQVTLPLQLWLSHISVTNGAAQGTTRKGIELPGNILANVSIEAMLY